MATIPQEVELVKLRGSEIPRVMKCSASRLPPKIKVGGSGAPASRGTLCHRMIAPFIRGEFPQEFQDRLALDDELGKLFGYARSMWTNELAQYYPDPMTEQDIGIILVEGIEITAHPDVVSLIETPDGIEVRVLDWKTGWLKTDDYMDQVIAYAAILARHFNAVRAVVQIAWVAFYEVSTLPVLQRDTLERFLSDLTDVVKAEAEYNVGEACKYCKRAHECEARRAAIKHVLDTLGDIDGDQIRKLGSENLAQMRACVKAIEADIERWKGQLDAEVRSFGPLHMPDGNILTFVEQPRREVVVEKARPLVSDPAALFPITPEQWDGCSKISITALLKVVNDSAPRGQKGTAKEAFIEWLKTGGGISVTVTETLKEVPAETV